MTETSVHDMDALAEIAEDDCLYVEAGDGSYFGKATLELLRDEIGGLNQSQVDARVEAVASGRKTKDFWMNPHMYPGTTQQPSSEVTIGTTAQAHLRARLFDPSSVEFVMFDWVIPDDFDESWGVAFIPIWTPKSTNTGDAVFNLRARPYAEGDAIDQSFIAPLVLSTDTALGTVDDLQYGPESSNDTYAGALVKGRAVVFRYERLSTSSTPADDFTGDAAIIGIRLVWMTDAPTED